nr:HD domain-containing protein [uncultured Anaeromusa sp.]
MGVKEDYQSELKQHFGTDVRRIQHALMVLKAAEMIMNGENIQGAMRDVVTITALLHDVGIKAAEQKYQSAAGPYQEIEGPPLARAILERRGAEPALSERVCYIIGGHHTASKNDGIDFQIIWEADLLVNIEEEGLAQNRHALAAIIEKNFKTATGKNLAKRTFLQ